MILDDKTPMDTSLTPAVDIAALQAQFNLAGQVAFVPGGYGALGEAICWALAVHGATVAVAGPSLEKAQQLANTMCEHEYKASGWPLDARNVADINKVVDKVVNSYGYINILVNCVGIQHEQSLLDVTEDTFDLMYQTNLKSAMFLAQAVARHQVAQHQLDPGRGGRHIHLLSVRSKLALRDRGYSAYCSTKGGLLMLVRQHAMELAPYNITVNGIAPTFIQSERIRPHLERQVFRDFILTRNPLGRIGEPIEVAGPVVSLAAPAASYITGQILYIDGGVTASQ